MTKKDLDILEEMYAKAILAAKGEGDYLDPKAQEKADTLKKLIDITSEDNEESDRTEEFIYKTRDKRDFMVALNGWKMVIALDDIIGWNRAIYNGKDYGEGSVIYRNKLIPMDEWERMTSSFSDKREIEYDWDRKVYKDKDGEVPSSEVFFVYTRDQINRKLESLMEDVSDFVYRIMG